MAITSTATVVSAFMVLLALVVATFVLWNRGRTPVRWASRVGLILATNVCSVLVTGLVLNNVFSFYGSWSELLGRHPHAQEGQTAVPQLDSDLTATLLRNFHSDRGTLVTTSIPGTLSGVRTSRALIYLPAAYGNPAMQNVRFPVVELLAGFPSSPSTWLRSLHINTVLDHAIADGEMAPTIAVMPTQNLWYPHDAECANVVGGLQVDTYLTYDVRSTIDHLVRASTSGSRWGLAGFSTGGYCAAVLAAQHPSLFGAAASLGGYNKAAHDATTGNLFGRDVVAADRANLLWWVAQPTAQRVPLLEIASRADRLSVHDDGLLDRLAARDHWPVWQLTLPFGGHNFATFGAELPTTFTWLSQRIGGPDAPMPLVDGLTPTPMTPSTAPAPQDPVRRASHGSHGATGGMPLES